MTTVYIVSAVLSTKLVYKYMKPEKLKKIEGLSSMTSNLEVQNCDPLVVTSACDSLDDRNCVL